MSYPLPPFLQKGGTPNDCAAAVSPLLKEGGQGGRKGQANPKPMNTLLHRSKPRTLLAALSLLAVATASHAAAFTLLVNGQPTPLDPAPLVKDGEVYLSADVLTHKLGVAVLPTKLTGMWVVSAYGTHVYIRANTTRFVRDGVESEAANPPLIQGGQMQVPVSTLAANFPFEVKGPFAGSLEITGPNATVQAVRQGSHPDFVRLVIDVSAPAPFYWVQYPDMLTVFVSGDPAATGDTFQSQTFPDPLAPEIVQEPAAGGGTNITIAHRCPTDALVFTLSDPDRIVIDFPRKPPTVPGPPTAPEDLEYNRVRPWTVHRLTTTSGPVVAYSILLPTGKRAAQIRPALANSTVHSRRTVSAIASATKAFAALNGGFYASDGSPLGMLVIDGEWIKAPILGRTVLGVMQDGSLQMGNVRFASTVTLPGAGTFTLNALNAGHSTSDEAVLYSRRWGTATADKGEAKATRVMISAANQILVVNAEGRGMTIPEGGCVLSVVGPRAASAAKATVGAVAAINLGTDPAWPGLRHAIGGGPRLVANGKPYVTSTTEHFRSDVAQGAAPRSAVGILPNGDALFIAVDGRQPGYSAGMTLGELALFLIKLGCKEAMNLDGGGSTTFVVDGRLANHPSDGAQRSVSNALLGFLLPDRGVVRQ